MIAEYTYSRTSGPPHTESSAFRWALVLSAPSMSIDLAEIEQSRRGLPVLIQHAINIGGVRMAVTQIEVDDEALSEDVGRVEEMAGGEE